MIKKVAFLAHPTRDLAGSKTFFETLGLKLTAEHGDAWAEYQASDGTTIALDTFSPKHDENARVYAALETDDIEAEVTRLREAGVPILHEPWTNKEEDGTEVCKMAMIQDPDGHTVMLHEIAAHRA